jgi:hypothetical protein
VKKQDGVRAEIARGGNDNILAGFFWGSGASIFDFFLNYADKRYIILRNINLRNGGC